jgi:hypothetical protein
MKIMRISYLLLQGIQFVFIPFIGNLDISAFAEEHTRTNYLIDSLYQATFNIKENEYFDAEDRKLLRSQGKDSVCIEQNLVACRKSREEAKKISIAHYSYEWKVNGLCFVGQEISVILDPSSAAFDTIYYHLLATDPPEWHQLLCKIPKKGEYEFAVNGCCGGFSVHKKGFDGTIKKAVVFKLLETDGKMYLGRFGDAGVILKKGKSMLLDKPCEFHKSAMHNAEPRISIEVIDTGKILRKALDENFDNEADTISNNSLEALYCFQKREFTDADESYSYYRLKYIAKIRYKWLASRTILILFNAKTGKDRKSVV